MREAVKPVVVRALGMFNKELESKLEQFEKGGIIETIQKWDWVEYWEESWTPEQIWCHIQL